MARWRWISSRRAAGFRSAHLAPRVIAPIVERSGCVSCPPTSTGGPVLRRDEGQADRQAQRIGDAVVDLGDDGLRMRPAVVVLVAEQVSVRRRRSSGR